MTIIKVAGLDPSLNNFGMVKGNLDLNTSKFSIDEMSITTTATDKKLKKVVRKNSDDLNRARALQEGLLDFIDDVSVVFVEVPVGSQSARAMASYGICIGVLSSIKIPMIQLTPTEVKVSAIGKKTATKQEMINWAINKHPNAVWLTRKQQGIVTYTQKNEHLADALASIYAGINTTEFNTAKSFLLKANQQF